MSGTATPLPLDVLGAYLQSKGLTDAGDMHVSVLAGGQSNPTFRIDAGKSRSMHCAKSRLER